MSHTLKVWESSFETYLDPTQWPEYLGLDYVSDPDLLRTKKGGRKKNGSEELWMNPMVVVKISMVRETSMRHRIRCAAQNATEPVIQPPLMIDI
jgi:hypothetical protein